MFRTVVVSLVLFVGCGGGAGGAGPDAGAGGGCQTCATLGAQCGQVADSCGGTLDCGGCPLGETCGVGGANRCGLGTCTPRTCASASAECGQLSDGCGSLLSCGSCAAPATCGGGGAANVCGGVCPASCPKGSECMSGACVVRSPLMVDLTPSLSHLTGTVTIDGATPVTRCPLVGRLRFIEKTRGDVFIAPVKCPTATGPFAYDVELPPGAWEVRFNLAGEWGEEIFTDFESTVPWHVVGQATTPSSSAANFDYRPVAVSGTLTANGAPVPRNDCPVQVLFVHVTDGTKMVRNVTCPMTAGPTTWSANLTRGRWQVFTTSFGGLVPYGINPLTFIDVTGPGMQLPLAVVSRKVSGEVRLNGQLLPSCLSPGYRVVRVVFTNAAGARTITSQWCPSDRFQVNLLDGTYRVTVEGFDGRPPPGLDGVTARMPDLVLNGADVTRTYDVQTVPITATILANGQQPRTVCTSTRHAYTVRLFGPNGDALERIVPCSGMMNTVSAWAVPGPYAAEILPDEDEGTLPRALLPANTTVPAAGGAVTLDVSLVRAKAKLLLGGDIAFCSDLSHVGFVADRGRSFYGALTCDAAADGTAWLLAPPGTYRVEAAQDLFDDSGPLVLQPSFVHAAEKLDLQYSVQRRQIRFQLSARNCAQSKRVTLELSNAATGERHALDAECFSASPPWVHGHISPGTWSATLVTDEPASFEDEPKWWPGMVRARVFSGLVVP